MRIFSVCLILLILFAPVYKTKAVTIYVGGSYPGDIQWCADTVKVTDSVYIEGSLAICAGTYVEFKGNYGIDAFGITAIGTPKDTIIITVNDTTGFHDFESEKGGWGGLNSRSVLLMEYCVLEHAKVKATDVPFYQRKSVISFANRDDNPSVSFISNCTFRKNCTMSDYTNYKEEVLISLNLNGPDIEIKKCVFESNFSTILLNDAVSSLIENNIFIENSGTEVIRCTGDEGDAIIRKNSIKYNKGIAILIGGDTWPSAHIIDNIIVGNGGGISAANIRDFSLTGNIITDNYELGGIRLVMAYPRVVNNFIHANNSNNPKGGGGISLFEAGMEIINCNITNNHASIGGGFALYDGVVDVYNSIIWGNSADQGRNQLINYWVTNYEGIGDLYSNFTNCLVEGGLDDMIYREYTGSYTNNVETDPLFVNPLIDDYRLANLSPCINSGKNLANLPSADLDGNPRIMDGIVDMGVYEFMAPFPEILRHPVSRGFCVGDTFKLEVSAFGGVLGYQWLKDGNYIHGQTGNALLIEEASPKDSAAYHCLVFAHDSILSTDTANIQIHFSPEVDLGGPFTSCANQPVILNPGDFKEYAWSTGDDSLAIAVTETGNYSVTVTDINGCSNTDSSWVEIFPVEEIDLGDDRHITSLDTIILEVDDIYESYLWSTGSQERSVMLHYYDGGEYDLSVQATNEFGCHTIDSITLFVTFINALPENKIPVKVTLYPNPAVDQLYLTFNSDFSEPVTIRLFDNSGKVALEKKVGYVTAYQAVNLNVSDFESGYYHLQINDTPISGRVFILP